MCAYVPPLDSIAMPTSLMRWDVCIYEYMWDMCVYIYIYIHMAGGPDGHGSTLAGRRPMPPRPLVGVGVGVGVCTPTQATNQPAISESNQPTRDHPTSLQPSNQPINQPSSQPPSQPAIPTSQPANQPADQPPMTSQPASQATPYFILAFPGSHL